jgi:hypothetical protein
MKKYISLFIVPALLLASTAGAMEKQPFSPVSDSGGEDSTPLVVPNDDVYLRNGTNETYNNYFSTLHATALKNDTEKNVVVKLPLFMQVCVQASKTIEHADERAAAFCELLNQIRSHKIEINTNLVYMTKKDLWHRLLTCIPTGPVHSLINGKKVELEVHGRETEQDKKYNAPLHENIDVKSSEAYRPPFQFKHSGERLTVHGYNFESDQAHHAKIVAEFNKLIATKQQPTLDLMDTSCE